MKINALLMDQKDAVVTCVCGVAAGEEIVFRSGGEILHFTAKENIPYCHKAAVRGISKGDAVIKYGEPIGRALEDIEKGALVSHENIESVPRDYGNEYIPLSESGEPLWPAGEFSAAISEEARGAAAGGAEAGILSWGGLSEKALSADEILNGLDVIRDPLSGRLMFRGYKRKEGRAGIRNHVLILPGCACSSETARVVAGQVRGAVNIVFNTGCSDVAANTDMSQKVLTGFALNPNVYGVVIIGLGCETVGHKELREKIAAQTSKPVVSFGIQEEGGTLKTIEKAVRAARGMAAEAALQPKELCDISELLLGIECGGSDATSGIAANPAVGVCSDLLVDLGASSILSESIEWIGAEHILAKRGATPAIHNGIIEVCRAYEEHLKAAGQDCRAGQPTTGNKAGGLSTLEEKSLGCIKKGGTRPVQEVLLQAERPRKQGALVMDTAGYDVSSVTSMAAGGCNLIIFTTGLGTPVGNAIVPVVKVTANERTYRCMEDNMDVDLSPVFRGEKTYREMGRELVGFLSDVCSGKLTKAEAYGFSDIAVDHVCRFV